MPQTRMRHLKRTRTVVLRRTVKTPLLSHADAMNLTQRRVADKKGRREGTPLCYPTKTAMLEASMEEMMVWQANDHFLAQARELAGGCPAEVEDTTQLCYQDSLLYCCRSSPVGTRRIGMTISLNCYLHNLEVPQESAGFSTFEVLYGWRVRGPPDVL